MSGMKTCEDEQAEQIKSGPEGKLEANSSALSRTDVSLSQFDFVGLGAIPKTPLQKILQAHQNLAPNCSGTVAELLTVASNPRISSSCV